MPSYLFVPDNIGLSWDISEVTPKDKFFTLTEMQAFVEGYIELLLPIEANCIIAIGEHPLSAKHVNADDYTIFGNEEARLIEGDHMVFNFPVSNWLGHDIVGPVIAIGREHDPEYAPGKHFDDDDLEEALPQRDDVEDDRL
jgi:hypothetical protein